MIDIDKAQLANSVNYLTIIINANQKETEL